MAIGFWIVKVTMFENNDTMVLTTLASGTVIYIVVPGIVIAKNNNLKAFIVKRYLTPLHFILNIFSHEK